MRGRRREAAPAETPPCMLILPTHLVRQRVRFGWKRTPAIRHQARRSVSRDRSRRSPGERIGTNLEVHGHGLVSLAAFGLPGRAVAAAYPPPPPPPAAVWVIDAAVASLGEEAHRVRQAQADHPPVLQGRHPLLPTAARDGAPPSA